MGRSDDDERELAAIEFQPDVSDMPVALDTDEARWPRDTTAKLFASTELQQFWEYVTTMRCIALFVNNGAA
eukprot:1639876-Amphidinium_carterae.2